MPLRLSSPTCSTRTEPSTAARTRGLIRICPGFASSHRREATFDTAYAALVDAAVGCALSTVNEESAGGVGQTTLDLNVTYLAAARGAEIFAEGTLLKRGRTIAFGEVRVTDAGGTLLAVGRATYMILAPRT